jgi:hypothetical protein
MMLVQTVIAGKPISCFASLQEEITASAAAYRSGTLQHIFLVVFKF